MRYRVSTILVIAVLCLAPTRAGPIWRPTARTSRGSTRRTRPPWPTTDGWSSQTSSAPTGATGTATARSPRPTAAPAFCGIDLGQGGPEQGDQQLVVYNDYNNGNHGDGQRIIEANVFQEQTIGAADVGNTWRFEFDAKRGNIEGASTALAFFKTLDPAAGWAMTNFITVDMTSIPDTWGSYSLSIFIDPSLEGQILQFGFVNWASNYEGSGIFYDNLNFDLAPLSVSLDIRPGGCPNPINQQLAGVLPAALLGAEDLDVNQHRRRLAAARRRGPDRCRPTMTSPRRSRAISAGAREDGPDGFLDLTFKFRHQDIVDAIDAGRTGIHADVDRCAARRNADRGPGLHRVRRWRSGRLFRTWAWTETKPRDCRAAMTVRASWIFRQGRSRRARRRL